MESEQVFALSKFETTVLDGYFRECPPDLAETGRALCRFLWDLDGRCHTQDWEGIKDRAAVFSLPVHLRRWRTSKNYAAVHRPLPGDETLTLEVILPSSPEIREKVLGRLDADTHPHTHALGQPRFQLAPGDFPGIFANLIRAARAAKAQSLTAFLEDGED